MTRNSLRLSVATVAFGRHRPHGQIGSDEVAIGANAQRRVADQFSIGRCFVQGGGQLPPQPVAGHRQNILPRHHLGGLQIFAGAANNVQDIAASIDENARRGRSACNKDCSVSSRRLTLSSARLAPRCGRSCVRASDDGGTKSPSGAAQRARNVPLAQIEFRFAV